MMDFPGSVGSPSRGRQIAVQPIRDALSCLLGLLVCCGAQEEVGTSGSSACITVTSPTQVLDVVQAPQSAGNDICLKLPPKGYGIKICIIACTFDKRPMVCTVAAALAPCDNLSPQVTSVDPPNSNTTRAFMSRNGSSVGLLRAVFETSRR